MAIAATGGVAADHAAAVHQAKVVPADGAAENNFGNSVAVSGDTMVVGAWRDDDLGDSSGSAYVFMRNGGVWVQQQKLTAPAPGGAPGDCFGVSVAVDGNTLVVGADHGTVGGNRTGAAYVFVRSGGTWSFQQRLTAGDAALGDLFGRSVAISGNTVVVGAPGEGAAAGAAYVFVRDGTVWTQQKKLIADDRASNDMFGVAVAISGDTVAVGADVDNAAFADSGSVYVFVRGAGLWPQQQHLTAPDAALGDNFGGSVALSGDTLVVGAASDDDVVHGTSSGSAYVFARSGGVWAPPTKLTASDAAEYNYFGASVALNGDTVVVGADGDSSAYMFVHGGGAWTQQAKLTPADGEIGDAFGSSLSISGNTLVIGAYQDSILGFGSGSAYVILVNAPPLADAGPDQTVLPGDRVKLSALNSRDLDDGIASYQWKQVSGKRVTLSNPGANQVEFIAPQVGAKGASLGFELKVTDRGGLQTTDRCLVTVTSDNRAPIAKAGAAQRVAGGTAVTLNGSRSRDPDRTSLKYLWKQICGPTVALSGRSTPRATFSAPTVGWGGGCLRFRLTVTDGEGLKAEDTTLVNVYATAGNQPPRARTGKGQTVAGGARVRLDGSASTDPDDGIVSCRWEQLSGPPVKLSNPLAFKPTFRSPKVGQGGAALIFQFTVIDQGGLQSQSRCQVRVKASP